MKANWMPAQHDKGIEAMHIVSVNMDAQGFMDQIQEPFDGYPLVPDKVIDLPLDAIIVEREPAVPDTLWRIGTMTKLGIRWLRWWSRGEHPDWTDFQTDAQTWKRGYFLEFRDHIIDLLRRQKNATSLVGKDRKDTLRALEALHHVSDSRVRKIRKELLSLFEENQHNENPMESQF